MKFILDYDYNGSKRRAVTEFIHIEYYKQFENCYLVGYSVNGKYSYLPHKILIEGNVKL